MPKCPVCGEPIEFGVMWCENYLGTDLVHEDCFEQYMDDKYGKHRWRMCEDDGEGGYYQYLDEGVWEGTGIFYTELTQDELNEMEDD